VEHYLEAHHSPDLFHVQHELVKAVSGPMAAKELSQNNFSKSTRLLYDPWREKPMLCLGIPGRFGSIQIPRGHRYTSFLKPDAWTGSTTPVCRTQRS
jgi:hypothetical protein